MELHHAESRCVLFAHQEVSQVPSKERLPDPWWPLEDQVLFIAQQLDRVLDLLLRSEEVFQCMVNGVDRQELWRQLRRALAARANRQLEVGHQLRVFTDVRERLSHQALLAGHPASPFLPINCSVRWGSRHVPVHADIRRSRHRTDDLAPAFLGIHEIADLHLVDELVAGISILDRADVPATVSLQGRFDRR